MKRFPSTSTILLPFAFLIKRGFPPTDLNARTGELTPPGIRFSASWKRAADFSRFICQAPKMWFHSKERPEVSQVNANFVDIVFLFDYPFEKTFLRVIMKKELQSGIFFIFIFTLLAACSNDPRTPNTPPPTTSSGWS